jgi:membrane protease YdiL (CAAX protease family)
MTMLPDSPPPGLLRRASHWTLLRVIVYVLAIGGTIVVFQWTVHFLVPEAPSPYHTPIRMLSNLAGAGLGLGVYQRLVRGIERRPAVELHPRVGGLAAGTLLGFALLAGTYLILWSLGMARFEAGDGAAGLAPGLIVFFCVGITEEVVFRAVAFRLIEQAGGTTVALAASALLFGFAHALNQNATLASSIDIAIEAGILLALAYALTRNLWFAVGIHLGWNFTEGTVFGGAVSGDDVPHSLIHSTLTGPDWLTGGTFGLEASAPTLGICLVTCVVLGVLVRRRGQWRPVTRFRFGLP